VGTEVDLQSAVRALRRELMGRAQRDRGLADAGHSVERVEGDAGRLAQILGDRGQQIVHALVPADQVGRIAIERVRGQRAAAGGLRRHPRRDRFAAQYPLVQRHQLGTRIDAQFLAQPDAGGAVRLERLVLPSGTASAPISISIAL
jgi:hypothetical protein